jgi:hypothetical protein
LRDESSIAFALARCVFSDWDGANLGSDGRYHVIHCAETNFLDAMSVKTKAQPEKKIELKGERPPGVIGEMKPKKALKMLRRWREEGSLEEEERVWEQLEPALRDSLNLSTCNLPT